MTAGVVPQAEHVQVNLEPASVLAAYARHRRRFAGEVAGLSDTELRTQSRCTEWKVADILRHGCDVDRWMQALWERRPPSFTSFDPNTTPHEFVVAARDVPDTEIRDRYIASAETMAEDVGESPPERWGEKSISPLGVVPWWLSVLHIFWDSWMHERDALLPLGIDVPAEPDEVVASLAYSLAMVGTFFSETTDAIVRGVRLVTAGGTTTVTPDGPLSTDNETLELVDALAGRGDVEEVLARTVGDLAEPLGELARRFLPAT